MTFLVTILCVIFSSSGAAENIKLVAILVLLGLTASVLLAQNSLAMGVGWTPVPF
jgi:hypothetical protein